MAKTSYIVVSPRYSRRVASFPAACALAASIDRAARSSYGAGAGADCHLVAERDGRLTYRGLIVGRTTIGRDFACSDYIVRRASTEG